MHYPRYDPRSPITPLGDDELDALDRLLQTLPSDGAMTLDGVDGYLTALVVGPPQVLASLATADWMPAVWGGDDEAGPHVAAPFASQRQRKNTVVMLLRHLRCLDHLLHDAPQHWEPIFSIAGDDADSTVDARDWCTGFLQGVDLQPQAWARAFDDPALAPLLRLGGGLDGTSPTLPDTVQQADLDDATACDALSREVPDAVLALARRFRAAPAGGD